MVTVANILLVRDYVHSCINRCSCVLADITSICTHSNN